MTTKYIVNNATGQTITGDITVNGNLNITGTTNTRPYKVFTALVTQIGGDNSVELTSGAVTKGVTYYITDGSDGDFSNVGAPSNDDGTWFIAINDEVPNSYGTALLRYNTGAPVVTVLENTIGNIWFTYNTTGEYPVNSNDLFIENKTTIDIDAYGQDGNAAGGAFISTNTLFTPSNFNILTTKGGSADDILRKNRLEIRVYN